MEKIGDDISEFFEVLSEKIVNFFSELLSGKKHSNDEEADTEEACKDAVAETEGQADTECVCTARVLCTNATEDSEPLHMKKEDSLIHISGISRLNKTDIEIDGCFRGCKKADACTIDKESIEGGVWQEVDNENDEGEGQEILNRDKSYMICTKHEGVIYFYDDGQEIKECLEEQKTAFSEWAKENRSDKVQFLEPFLQVSMAEQLRTGVPWQVTLAQIAYESGWGQKEMYDEYTKKQSFNLFGIKYFGNTEDNDKYVRSWTTEYISSSELDKWEEEQKRWALNGEKLINMGVSENNKIKIKVIQAFRRYESYKESIVDHSDILLDERYAEAWEYKDNPFIYVSIIGPIYATGSDYGDTAASIMHDYFMWDDEEKDWEEYILWREGK